MSNFWQGGALEQVIGNNIAGVSKILNPSKKLFELEGHRIEIIPKLIGDMKYNSVVWIPSIKTLYGSDLLFNGAHPFTCELTGGAPTVDQRSRFPEDLGAQSCYSRSSEVGYAL